MRVNVNRNAKRGPRATSVSRGRAAGFVPFLFGVAGTAELPGVVLTRLLGELGLSEPAARAALARMQKAGNLSSTRRGRYGYYRLAGDLERGFQRARAGANRATPPWTGRFHALHYQVLEAHRGYRDSLRRAAILTGYGLLQQGVLIALTDRSDTIADVLARCPAGSAVYRTELVMSTSDAARAAFDAWDLAELARVYRRHIRTLRAALRATSPPPANARTLTRFTQLSTTPLTDTLRAPALPAELRPADWPLAELFAVIGQVHARYGPPAAAYVHTLLAESGAQLSTEDSRLTGTAPGQPGSLGRVRPRS
jgi:phenylacetic acid degradation operon negative regulatory protein